MTVAATGARGIAMEKLVSMVSQSATFIAKTSSLNATAALQFIHIPWLQKNKSDKRPCAIVTPDELHSERASNDCSVYGGKLRLWLLDTARAEDKAEGLMDFINFVDGVTNDLVNTLSGVGANLVIQGTTEPQPPAEVDPQSNSEFVNHYACTIDLEWAPYLQG